MVLDIPPPPHNWLNVGLILACVGTFLVTAAFSALSGSGAGVPDVFFSTQREISAQYELFITPAGFTFSIWSIIFLWLAASLVILLVTLFKTTEYERLYLSPEIASPMVTGTLSLNFILTLAWIFIWDRASINPALLILACICLFLVAITNILVMCSMAKNISDHSQDFYPGSPLFWWGVGYRVILNGLGTYSTWTVVASLLNLATALVYAGEVDQRDAALAALGLLVICHASWFVVENFVIDSYARYIWTPYLVIIWAINGIRAKQFDDPNVPQDLKNFVFAILIIAILTVVVRSVLVIFRMVRKPIYKVSSFCDFIIQ